MTPPTREERMIMSAIIMAGLISKPHFECRYERHYGGGGGGAGEGSVASNIQLDANQAAYEAQRAVVYADALFRELSNEQKA